MTKIVIFEGPDLSGKTTRLNSVCEKLKENDKKFSNKINTFKFPAYSALYGDEILDHLKTFDIEKEFENAREAIVKKGKQWFTVEELDSFYLYRVDEEFFKIFIHKLERFSMLQLKNKEFMMDSFANAASHSNVLLVDRFTLSQYVYDNAWTDTIKTFLRTKIQDEFVSEKPGKEAIANQINEFRQNIIDRAYVTHLDFLKTLENKFFYENDDFELLLVYFHRSEFIRNIVKNNKDTTDRRIDSYDTNKTYQANVASIFDCAYSEAAFDSVDHYRLPVNGYKRTISIDTDDINFKLQNGEKLENEIDNKILEFIGV